jgi:hypothetical protein
MLKISAPGLTALFFTASLQVYAQVPGHLTEMGVSVLAHPCINFFKNLH